MRGAAGLLLLSMALGAGCASPPADPVADCAAGPGPFLLVVLGNKDFFSSAEEVAKDRYDTVDREGRLFHFVAMPGEGTGQVAGPDPAFVNVTRDEVRVQLGAIGKWNASQDHAVEAAWRAKVPQAELGRLCQVLDAESDPPREDGPRIGCDDGGTALVRVSTSEGAWERTVGCLPDSSQAAFDSGHRILQAFHAAQAAAGATVGQA